MFTFLKRLSQTVAYFAKSPEAMATILVAVATLTIGMASKVLMDPQPPLPPPPAVPPPPPPPKWPPPTPPEVHDLEGVDAAGNKATFQYYIFSQELSWVFGSASEVELNDNSYDMVAYLRSSGLQAQLRAAGFGIIAVGAASVEGNNAEEESRAQQRAMQLITWVREAMLGEGGAEIHRNLYTLALGRYSRCPTQPGESTVRQRRVVLIAILRADRDIDLRDALWNALGSDESFSGRSCYSQFTFTPFSQAP